MPGDNDGSRDPRLIKWAAWIGGLAGALMAVITVVVFFFTGWKPEEPCRGVQDGILSSPTVDQNVSYGAYLELTGGDEGEASSQRLREIGKLVSFRIETEGYKDEDLRLTWWLLKANGEPTSNPRHKDQLGLVVSPEECEDSGRRKLWAGPIPTSRAQYLVEVRLLDPKGEELDAIRTPPFSGLH